MNYPFLPVSRPDLTGNEKLYVNQALDEGWISSSGRFLDRFEAEFAAFAGTAHALGCCNGTVALHLLLLAMGIGPGDEVVVPAFTYVASANAVAYTGARPVFVDVEPEHWNLDPARLEAALTPRTRAVMAVHLYGHPADMAGILRITARRGIPVLEDAAEAHGAEVNGSRVGSLGLGAAFSFYGNKILTTGEGGMITTDDPGLAARIRLLRGQGMDPDRRYWFPVRAHNYRMTNLAAALGCAQLERAQALLAQRRELAAAYERALAPRAGALGLQLPSEAPSARSVYWLYSLRVPAAQRDPLMAHLARHGIETRPFFPPLPALPMYQEAPGRYPVAEELAATGLNLPTYSGLTGEQVARVAGHLLDFLAGGV